MKTKHLILIVCLFVSNTEVNAQNFGNKLKNKVINKIEQKAEQKADQAINNAVDKPVDKTEQKVKESVTEGSNSRGAAQPASTEKTGSTPSGNSNPGGTQTPDDAQMQKYMEMMGGGAVTISDYPDLADIKPSPWVGSFDMVTSGVNKNGKPIKDQDGQISWYIDKYDVAIIPDATMNGQKQDVRMVVKRKQGIMLVLTTDDGKKTGMVIKMKTISVDLSQTDFDKEMEGVQVEVNRNITKTVNNLPCYQVKAWNDQFESISWVSDKIGINFPDLMGFMNVKGENSTYEKEFGHIGGLPVQTISTDKKTGDVSTMDIKNVFQSAPNPKYFSDDGYDLMQMPDIGAFGGYGGQ